MNRVVVKTGKIKSSYYLPINIENALTKKKLTAIKEEDLFEIISNVDRLIKKGDECNCVLENDKLIWVDHDGDKLPFNVDDSDFEDIEINEKAYEMWKEKRTAALLSTLNESEKEALQEFFVGLVKED